MIKEILWMLRYIKRSACSELKLWWSNLDAWRRFWRIYHQYQRIAPPHAKSKLRFLYPCLGDDTSETPVEPIYFYQDAWAFGKIVKTQPEYHVDVGSHHKFVGLLSKVVPVVVVDIRPLSLPLDTLEFRKGSILDLPFEDASVPSVSSLCVVEHIGLGRYGDSLDPYGSEKAIDELKRIVRPDGDLYLSLPLDDENRVYFNAHRVFKEEYLLKLFKPFQILESRYIYGREFGEKRKTGFGFGCYYLRNVAKFS